MPNTQSKLKINSGVNYPEKIAKRKKKARLKHSHFMFTINTNIKSSFSEEGGRDRAERFKELIDRMFKFIIKTGNGITMLNGDAYEFGGNIVDVEIKHRVEVGDLRDLLHTHVLLSIDHRTKIHLDREFMRLLLYSYLDDEFGAEVKVKTPYISHFETYAGAKRTAIERWEDYIMKRRSDHKDGDMDWISDEDEDAESDSISE